MLLESAQNQPQSADNDPHNFVQELQTFHIHIRTIVRLFSKFTDIIRSSKAVQSISTIIGDKAQF